MENENVKLRYLTETDFSKLVQYANNDRVTVNLRDAFPKPYTLEDAKSFKKMIDDQNPKTFFAIEYNSEYAGNISLMTLCDIYRKSAEIGYFIAEPFWNKGIATKAVNLITEWGFQNLDIVRIHAGVFSFNSASQRVLEKCGYTKEGIFKQAVCKNGEIYDEVRYAKIKE